MQELKTKSLKFELQRKLQEKKTIFRKRRSNKEQENNWITEKEEKKSIMFGLLMSVQSLLPLSLLNVLVVFNTEFKGFFLECNNLQINEHYILSVTCNKARRIFQPSRKRVEIST